MAKEIKLIKWSGGVTPITIPETGADDPLTEYECIILEYLQRVEQMEKQIKNLQRIAGLR